MPARVDDAPARRSCRPSSRALRRPGGPDPLLPASTSSKRPSPGRRRSRLLAELEKLQIDHPSCLTLIYECRNLPSGDGARIVLTVLKRENLVHGGAHKGTNALRRCWPSACKTRLIAETGAGQHVSATAMAVALTSLDCAMSWTEEPAPWRMEASRPGSADAPSQPPPPIWSLHDRVLLSMP